MSHKPTDEQRAILDHIKLGKENLVVEALAGSGKSWTALQALTVIPQRSILMAAFSKPIATFLEAQVKQTAVPRTHAIHVKTFHALGFGIIKASHPNLNLNTDGNATEAIVAKVCQGRAISFKTKRYIVRLLKLLKDTTVDLEPEADFVLGLAVDHEIFGARTSEDDMETTIDRVLAAYEASRDIANLTQIDFCDMTWLPSVCNLPPSSRYQAIIIDELQDISEPQFALLQHCMLPATRIIAIGDRRQAIYGWRSGMGDRAWAVMQDHFKAKTLWLTTTFRCSNEVVKQANVVLSIENHLTTLKALPDANDGSVTSIKLADLPHQFVGGPSDVVHTFVLSRRNDVLLDCALFLHRSKTRFQLVGGKDMLAPLFELLDYKLDLGDAGKFRKSLSKWREEQIARAEKLNSPSAADRVEEQYKMLMAALESAGKPTLIKGLLGAILADNLSGVWLSTVHKVKGLEAQRVFLLRQSFARHANSTITLPDGSEYELGPRQQKNWNNDDGETIGITIRPNYPQEELNIEYVAITRAKEHLVWVDMDRKQTADVKVDEAIKGLEAMGDAMIKKSSTAELEIAFARADREGQRLTGVDDKAAEHWMAYAGKVLTEINTRSKEAK